VALRYALVDVFTDIPLAGNQLAVFTDGRGLETETMQALALELGFSETTFVLPPAEGGTARMRIFTPASELAFAGHPTLGTAWVLGSPLQLGVVTLETGSGLVPVALERDASGAIVFGRMEQPVPAHEPWAATEQLFRALGIDASALPVEVYDNGIRHVFVALGSEDEVAELRPDMAAFDGFDVVGVNCFAGSGDRWKLRMFSPVDGMGEDAATGSAAGPLACHLARHGRIGWGDRIVVSQGAEIGRPSTLHARAEGGRGGVTGVEVGGSAVVVARGEFRL
jgi:trans-2,3-dihydro-3-hydroxyanthranilate isomerase